MMRIMLHTIAFLVIMASLTLPTYAQDISPECATEPTDVTLSYGDALVCAIESEGDSDLFRFFGNIGDPIIIEAERVSSNATPFVCQQLRAPTGETLADTCVDVGSPRIELLLSHAGVHTIIVKEEGDTHTVTYNISLSCLSGTCTPPTGDAMLAVTPASHDFGSINLNTASATTVFLVSNAIDPNAAATPTLMLGSIALAGPQAGEFAILTDTCSNRFIPAGLSCRVEVNLMPTTLDAKAAMLVIPSNDPVFPVFEVNLSGTGSDGLPDPIGGAVTGISPTNVVCTNLTTGASVFIPNSASFWDCEVAGLMANPGEQILQSVTGTAN